jgi:hypothetical protein
MIHFLTPFLITVFAFLLTRAIWKNTREISFPIGSFLIFYWTILGGWLKIFDEVSGGLGKEIGFQYYYFNDLVFPVQVDAYYHASLALYGVFYLGILTTVWIMTKNRSKEIQPDYQPVVIRHEFLVLFCIAATLISFFLISDEILTAAKFKESVYVVTRHQPGRWNTLHQLLNQAAVLSLFIGLICFLTGKEGKLFSSERKKYTLFLYILGLIMVEGILLLEGNRKEIFFGGIFALLFYFHNAAPKPRIKIIALFMVLTFTPVFFSGGLRSYSPVFLTNYFDVSENTFSRLKEFQYSGFTAKGATLSFLFSNEIFFAHFSLYGVILYAVPFTWGSSLISLAASAIPRAFWENRPPPVYEYYVEQVHAMPGQGYTIHHATAWYLNFGIPGIVAGALILGLIWGFLYRSKLAWSVCVPPSPVGKAGFLKIFFSLGLAGFTAGLPGILRTGPEGYKTLIVEDLLMPALLIFLSIFWYFKRK